MKALVRDLGRFVGPESSGDPVDGLRYRRRAADGSSSKTGGRFSSVYGTLGSMVRMDRVRKSSGGIDARVREEKDLAAERMARRDAVKLDLNADLRGNREKVPSRFALVPSAGDSKTLKSSSSMSTLVDRG